MWTKQNFFYGNLDWGKELSEDTEFLRVISHTNNFLWGAVLWSTLQERAGLACDYHNFYFSKVISSPAYNLEALINTFLREVSKLSCNSSLVPDQLRGLALINLLSGE